MTKKDFGILEVVLIGLVCLFIGYTIRPILDAPPKEIPVQIQTIDPEEDVDETVDIGFVNNQPLNLNFDNE